jgi:hypothetical protein
MKIAVGHSVDPLLAHALEEIFTRCEAQLQGARPHAGILFTCIDCDHQAVLDAIQQRWPGLPLIGCTTDGELTSELAFQEDSISLQLFSSEKIKFYAGLGDNLSKGVRAAVARALADAPADAALCVALPESLTVSGASVVQALQGALGPRTTLVGGTAGDQWSFSSTRQFFGDQVLQDSLPVLLFHGALHQGVGVSSGWLPMGKEGLVTRAKGNIVYEINDIPALSYYKYYLGESAVVTQEYPLGVFEEEGSDQYYMRAPLSFNEVEGSVTFAGDVPQGSRVYLTEAGRGGILSACEASIQMARARYSGEAPQGALVISCAARKQLLGTRTEEEYQLLAREISPDLPVIGFYSYGEIAPLEERAQAHFHNETFVTVLLGE